MKTITKKAKAVNQADRVADIGRIGANYLAGLKDPFLSRILASNEQSHSIVSLSQLCLFYLPIISTLGPRLNVPSEVELTRMMQFKSLSLRIFTCDPSLVKSVDVHPFMKIRELNEELQNKCALTQAHDMRCIRGEWR